MPKKQAPSKQQQAPQQQEIVSFKIKLPRQYYNLFSEFANFLYNSPAQHPQTGEFIIDPKTGKPKPSLPAPDIATYFVTCAFNTYTVYQMMRQQQQQAQQQQRKQPSVPQQ